MRVGERWVAGLGRTGVGMLAGATILGFAGGLSWALDLLAHFRPQYLGAGLVLALMLALAGRARWVAAAFATAAINAIPIVPLYLQKAESVPTPGRSLRVMSINISDVNHDHARMLQYVGRQRLDVLILLEVTARWVPAVNRLTAEYPHYLINPGTGDTGIAMLSRERPIAKETIDLAQSGIPSYLFTLPNGNGHLSILATHLSWPLGARTTAVRNAQLDAIAALAQAHAYPLIVMGDFNTTPFSAHFGPTLRVGGLMRCGSDSALTPTWPARIVPLLIQLDHCLATANARTWNFRVGEYMGSDHYPIAVDVAVEPTGE